MKVITMVLAAVLALQIANGQTWQDTLSLINKDFSQYLPDNPGCQLSISKDEKLVFSKSWGMADLERKVPLTTNSILEAGSVSKQFTAASILLLEQQGKLSLMDNIRKYIPEIPTYENPIFLRELLNHTSGIRDWSDIVELTAWPRGQKFYTNNEVLDIITRQQHLNNKPGGEFLYSNSNYVLLAIIVQLVSNLSLADFTQKYIFEPAGMTQTQWRDDPNRVVPNRAIAYSKYSTGFKIDMPNENVYGPGGLLTTTEDLLRWTNYYQSGKFGNPSLLKKMTETGQLNNGVKIPYASGLYMNKVMGWDNISHDGSTAGYRAYLETFPELKISIAILSNTSQFNIDHVADVIRKIFIQDKSEKSKEIPNNAKMSFRLQQSLPGMYVNERNRSTFRLAIKDSTLTLDDYLPLSYESGTSFKANGFLIKTDGIKGLYIPLSPLDTMQFSRVQPVTLSKNDFKTYEGNYFSQECNSSIIVESDSSKLLLRFNSDRIYSLVPTYKDAFTVSELGCDLQFIRNVSKKVVRVRFYFWRTRGIEFIKSAAIEYGLGPKIKKSYNSM